MKAIYIILLMLLNAAGCGKKSTDGPPAPVLPKATIYDLSLPEGNSGNKEFRFVVTLDAAATSEVSFDINVAEGTARSGEDFTPIAPAKLRFAAGSREQYITVQVTGDDVREGEDEFTVTLSAPVNALIAAGTAKGIIKNDDTRVPFTNAGYDAPGTYAGYTVVWKDEFDNNALDAAAWSFENGDGCPNICGWGNNELEYYRPENLFFQDGKMIIEAKKESFGGKSYTSSKILTRGKKVLKFGRIDIRAKLPKGRGIWPAFWMLPQHNVFGGWPRSGEIDIMEVVGHEPNRTHGTLHYGPGPGSTQINRSYVLPTGDLSNEFHVYSLEWKQDQIKWYVDGNLFSTVNRADLGTVNYPFNEDFFLIINLAVGGNWPGSPDTATYFPQWLIVDYVRVYQ